MRLASTLSHQAPLSEVVEQARLLDGLGYDSIWIPEILGRDALTTVALLGAHVDRARLATGVVPLAVRSPTTLAMTAATVAEALPGRFTLGIGAGHPELQPSFGVPALRRLDDVKAYLDVLRGLLDGGRVRAPRTHIEVGLRGTHVQKRPSIVLAALRPGMVRLGATVADGIIMNWVTPEYAASMVQVARAAAEASGRDPDEVEIACYIPVCVTDQVPAARRVVARQVSAYGHHRAYRGLWEEAGYEAVRVAVEGRDPSAFERASLLNSLAAIGDHDTVRARLSTFADAGVTLPILAPLAVGEDEWGSMLTTWTALAPGQ